MLANVGECWWIWWMLANVMKILQPLAGQGQNNYFVIFFSFSSSFFLNKNYHHFCHCQMYFHFFLHWLFPIPILSLQALPADTCETCGLCLWLRVNVPKTIREKRKGKDNRDEQKKENKKRRIMKKHTGEWHRKMMKKKKKKKRRIGHKIYMRET